MFRSLFVFSLVLSGLALGAIEVKNKIFDAEIDPRGAVVTKLVVQGKAWSPVFGKRGSFDDQIGRNLGPQTQGIEYTDRLDFELEKMTVSSAGTRLDFSVRSPAYPGLRLWKSYIFSAAKPEFTLRWELRNTGKTPLEVSLNTRSFLLRDNMVNSYLHPRGKGFAEFRSDEEYLFTQAPERPVLALRNDKNDGAVIFLPVDDTAGAMNWILKGPFGGYTQEFFSTQKPILPGKSRSMEIKVVFTSDVMGTAAAAPFRKGELQGTLPVQVERLNRVKPKAKILYGLKNDVRAPEKFIDVTFNRQFNDAWRCVQLPADAEKLPVAVWRIENGSHAADRPVEFFRKGNCLVLKVPGLLPDGGMAQNDGRAWNVVEKGYLMQKSAPFLTFGKVAFPCRIAIGDGNGREVNPGDISAGGALFINYGFERADAKRRSQPEGVPFTSRKSAGVTWLGSAPGTSGRCLQAGALHWDFLPEPGLEYRIRFRAKSIVGGEFSYAGVAFFGPDGQWLKNLRKTIFYTKRPFDWQEFELTFRMPDNAALIRFSLRNGKGERQSLLLDDLRITSEVLSAVKQSRKEVSRRELDEVWHIPLSLLEPISMENVSPHEKWFKPAAQVPGEILFLSDVGGSITRTIGRRMIVELAQRNDLKFRHIPLIRKILSTTGAYSVYKTDFAPRLSDYTLACLKELPARPGVVCILEFDLAGGGKEFHDLLRSWQKAGTNIYFFQCLNIPKEMLGKNLKPAVQPLMPQMRINRPQAYRRIQWFDNGKSLVAVRAPNFRYLAPFIPQEVVVKGIRPILCGRDFPWFEFEHQLDMTVLRRLSGIVPAVSLTGADAKGVTLKSAGSFKGALEFSFRSLNRDRLGDRSVPLDLAAGTKVFPLPVDGLPAGDALLYLRIVDEKKKVVDMGAVKVTLPGEVRPQVVFADPERIFRRPSPVSFKVTGVPADQELLVEIENNHGEVVFREKRAPGAAETAFTVKLPGVPTALNYVRVRTSKNGVPAGQGWGEFAVTGLPLDLKDYHGFMNCGPVPPEAVRNLGFEFVIAGDPRRTSPGIFRLLRCCNFAPVPRRGDDKAWFRTYRNDVKTDPVRKPCFSSPEFKKQMHDETAMMVKRCDMRYYDVSNLWSGDEMFLGRSVCYSSSCLAEFRGELKKQYGTVAALNREWGSAFGSFDEVVPKQREELKFPDNLSPWLDHKMFMTKVFAKHFFGTMRDELAALVPGAKTGPTGTPRPGYGYNWREILKYCRIVGYYSGVQTTLINDFGEGGLLAGQCGGGYTHGHIDYEPYNYDTMWQTLINGGNLAYHYFGCAVNGDWKITDNMKYFSKSMKELKRGIGCVWLNAAAEPEVAVLFSMPSLFTAVGTVGEQLWHDTSTSWMKLLGDLRIESRFLASEEAAEKGIPARYKAVILPMTLALSDRVIEALVKFAERGGIVIADTAPGRFDEHGKRRNSAALDRLFVPFAGEIKTKYVTLPGVKGSFETLEQGVPFGQFKQCGKGGGMNFNLLVSRYSVTQSGGTGGEVSAVTEGEAQLLHLWQKQAGDILLKAGVRPFARVSKSDGSLYGCHARFRQEGPNRFYAFHRPAGGRTGQGRFDFAKGDKVRVQIPVKGHVYEIRSGKYLGFTDTFDMNMVPGWSMIYAVLPQAAGAVTLKGPDTVIPRGGKAQFSFVVAGTAGPQVFHFALSGPDGAEIEHCARNFHAAAGRGGHEVFIPLNAAPGVWKAEITHTVSGKRAAVRFTVK